jgi:hypothetical protein
VNRQLEQIIRRANALVQVAESHPKTQQGALYSVTEVLQRGLAIVEVGRALENAPQLGATQKQFISHRNRIEKLISRVNQLLGASPGGAELSPMLQVGKISAAR